MNQKIRLLSKSISILLNVFIVLIVLQLVYFAFVVFDGGSFSQNKQVPSGIFTVFSMGRKSGIVDQSIVDTINVTLRYILLFLTLVGYVIVSRIFSGLAKSEVPFKTIQVRKIYLLSGLSFLGFFVISFLPSLLYAIFLEGTYVQMNIDGGLLLIGLMFYTLAEIFKYGQSLQQDVDEIL
ncbi:hypothetical protein [Marinilactibacillus kalidii]|uniref:hypothetical protein n=1 Tax=Marinilactibacillus kalidii TaxID=2820274 RepID=UPI001ABE17FD|nr:hypothetical protein [Marinilactibacillus kalidii]